MIGSAATPPLAPIAHPFADAFLLGFVAACSLMAALFFLKFWKTTRDVLFLAFALFFLTQGITGFALLGIDHPNEAGFWNALIRFMAVIGLLAAILWKNVAAQ